MDNAARSKLFGEIYGIFQYLDYTIFRDCHYGPYASVAIQYPQMHWQRPRTAVALTRQRCIERGLSMRQDGKLMLEQIDALIAKLGDGDNDDKLDPIYTYAQACKFWALRERKGV